MKKILSLAIMRTLFAAVCAKGGDAKYVFFFIGDGMGMNQVNGTEMYLAQKEGVVGNQSLLFTQFPYTGFAKTYSTDHSITYSAAGGTALALGENTQNGTIGMDRNPPKNLAPLPLSP